MQYIQEILEGAYLLAVQKTSPSVCTHTDEAKGSMSRWKISHVLWNVRSGIQLQWNAIRKTIFILAESRPRSWEESALPCRPLRGRQQLAWAWRIFCPHCGHGRLPQPLFGMPCCLESLWVCAVHRQLGLKPIKPVHRRATDQTPRDEGSSTFLFWLLWNLIE